MNALLTSQFAMLGWAEIIIILAVLGVFVLLLGIAAVVVVLVLRRSGGKPKPVVTKAPESSIPPRL